MPNGLDIELVPADGKALLPETLLLHSADSPTNGPGTPGKTPPVLDDHLSPIRAGSTPPEAVATTPPLEDREGNPRMSLADTPPRAVQGNDPEDEDEPDIFGEMTREVRSEITETVTRVTA
jgi:hypothetical protein